MYLDNRHMMSFNYPFNLIIGANGCGKTYASKRLVFKKAIYEGKKFIWLRTSEAMIDELKSNNGRGFFVDVAPRFKKCDGKIVGDTIYINDKYSGYVMSVSTFFNKKGRSFNDIDYIVYDEFIDEVVQKRLKNKVLAFVKALESIVRLKKDVKIIMNANALDRGDEILQLFNFNINDYGYYFNKKLGAVLWYVKDDEVYHEEHSKSLGGRLMPSYVLNNEFLHKDYQYYTALPKGAKYIYTLEGEMGKMGVYAFMQDLYIEPISDKSNNITLVKSIDEISSSSTLIKKPIMDGIRRLYTAHRVRFKNQFIEKNFIYYIS